MATAEVSFSDVETTLNEFSSTWREGIKVSSSASATQTVAPETASASCQTLERLSVSIQTDPVESAETMTNLSSETVHKLAEFVRRVAPRMEKELADATSSTAFDSSGLAASSKAHMSLSMAVQLTVDAEVAESARIDFSGVSATTVAWNAVGTTLAVGYGTLDHSSWCTHHRAVCVWSVARRSFAPSKPDYVLDTASCVCALAFHPSKPSLVAAGLFNGAMCIWDLARAGDADTLIALTAVSKDSHTEPVGKIEWLPGERGRPDRLVSVAGDGRMIVWELARNIHAEASATQNLTVVHRLALTNRGGRVGVGSVAGATAMSRSPTIKDTVVIGTETGRLYRARVPTPQSGTVPTDANPISFAFEPHSSPIHEVHCSPHHRNLFVSSGADGMFRVYNNLKARPLTSVYPGDGYLFCVRWSPFRPLVLAVGSADGSLYVFDLLASPNVPVSSTEPNRGAAVLSVAWNPADRALLATVDAAGGIFMWNVPSSLSREKPAERSMLDSMGAGQKTKSVATPTKGSGSVPKIAMPKK